jgi:hypothetical protein
MLPRPLVLVTPKLSPGPLQTAALAVVFAVVLQSIVVVLTFARGDLVGATAQSAWSSRSGSASAWGC